MIDLSHLRGHTIAILGLGKSGLAAAAALARAGACVRAWDDGAPARAAAAGLGVAIADPVHEGFGTAEALMLSPGIPRSHPAPHPAVARALAEGLPVIGDIDLLAEAQPAARYLGVTGTNGKSTTTALIGHVLAMAGIPAAAGGNLGTPALALPPLGADGWYVIELSSYQLETVSAVRWDVGMQINLSPDHLDRYPDLDAYAAAKRRLLDAIRPGGTAVIGVDDPHGRTAAEAIAARDEVRLVRVSTDGAVPGGVWIEADAVWQDGEGGPRRVFDLSAAPALPGAHNAQNIACAWAACRAVGLDEAAIAAGISTFPGLRHRLQRVAEIDGVLFVNDSKATNADAAARALASYDRIWWIAGGRPKPGGIGALDPLLPRIRRAFLIGEAAPAFAAHLEGRVPSEIAGELAVAVRRAFAAARAEGGVVLLSPACASFDQFPGFEARGDAFVGIVEALAAEHRREAV